MCRVLEKKIQRLAADQEEVAMNKKLAVDKMMELEKTIAMSKLEQNELNRNYESLKEDKLRVCMCQSVSCKML